MSDTSHLAELLNDYDNVIAAMETSGLPIEQIKELEGMRMVLHDMIIEEVERLGYETRTRSEAIWIARQIV
jgi:hypothetical protein